MAGEWIKMRSALVGEREVIAIAYALKMEEDMVLGKLFRLWEWADRHTTDGLVPQVPIHWVDEYLKAPGFAAAMSTVGWLRPEGDGFAFPNWDHHNGESAKKRCMNARRQSKKRFREDRCHADVTQMSRSFHENVTLPALQKSDASSLLSSSSFSESGDVKPRDVLDSSARETTELEEASDREFEAEGFYEHGQISRQVQRWARCGAAKARSIVQTLKSPKNESLAAWQAWEKIHGTQAAIGAAQSYGHPDEVPPVKSTDDIKREKRRAEIKRIVEGPGWQGVDA